MLNNKTAFTPHEMKKSVISIYSYNEKNIYGTLVNPYYQQEMQFHNVVQLLFLMDHMLNSLQFPQESMSRRLFHKTNPEAPKPIKAMPLPDAPLATFVINVIFRQNASWQGSIIWKEGEVESSFRSVLELIMLMDNVLTGDASQSQLSENSG